MLHVDAEIGALAIRCRARRCGVHWWAIRLHAGDVRAQLRTDLGADDQLINFLVRTFALPTSLDRPTWWQVWISSHEWAQFHQGRHAGVRGRSLALLTSIARVYTEGVA